MSFHFFAKNIDLDGSAWIIQYPGEPGGWSCAGSNRSLAAHPKALGPGDLEDLEG